MPALKAVGLHEAIDQYLGHVQSMGRAEGTMKSRRSIFNNIRTHMGNPQVKSINMRHIDSYFQMRQSKGIAPGSLNNEAGALHKFFVWCVAMRYLGALDNPMSGRGKYAIAQRERLRVPASDFKRLLDAADNRRDRMVIALGLWTMLRQSEIGPIRWQDVDMDGGSINVVIKKGRKVDTIPIPLGLDRELRSWQQWYMEDQGITELDKTWYVVPARRAWKYVGVAYQQFAIKTTDSPDLQPTSMICNMHDIAKRALVGAGFAIADHQGKSTREGMHTLRRSGARAWFDKMVDEGYDGALRLVQAQLHHANSHTTEVYLGLDLDRRRRDLRVRGRDMFGTDLEQDNIIEYKPLTVVSDDTDSIAVNE